MQLSLIETRMDGRLAKACIFFGSLTAVAVTMAIATSLAVPASSGTARLQAASAIASPAVPGVGHFAPGDRGHVVLRLPAPPTDVPKAAPEPAHQASSSRTAPSQVKSQHHPIGIKAPNRPVYQSQPSIATGDLGTFQACVKQRESNGNYRASNSAGAMGAYQWMQGTWDSQAREAGFPQYVGTRPTNVPPDVQDKVFLFAAGRSRSPWACTRASGCHHPC